MPHNSMFALHENPSSHRQAVTSTMVSALVHQSSLWCLNSGSQNHDFTAFRKTQRISYGGSASGLQGPKMRRPLSVQTTSEISISTDYVWYLTVSSRHDRLKDPRDKTCER